MKFIFKRKYTSSFFLLVVLVLISVAFYIVGPMFINREIKFFNQILLISLVDSLLITLFVIGLSRTNYYLYHDKIEIHRSFHRTIHLDYQKIDQVVEKTNDPIFLIFGSHPSLKIKYKNNGKIKKYSIRVEKHQLLKLILENEKQIHIITNN